nr:ImmA/IrrE family metallo-endopeptidase [Paenibacillus xylanexedens]
MNEIIEVPIGVATNLFRRYYTQPGNDVLIYNCEFILSTILEQFKISADPYPFRVESFCGLLAIDDYETTIVYNELHIPSRRNFTIAHELGHYFLHSKEKRDFVDRAIDMLDYEDKILEVQANAFASELVVPDDVLSLMLSYRYSFYRISKITSASVSCLRWRLLSFLKNRINLPRKHLILLVNDYETCSQKKQHNDSHIFKVLSKSTPWEKIRDIVNSLEETQSFAL